MDLPVVKQSDNRVENEPVRLIGFVDVGTLKALLAFDGKIRGLEVGEVHRNVEVVSIEPPRVTLQRGRERWITALFDQPVVNAPSESSTGSSDGPQVTVGQPASARGGLSTPWPLNGLGTMFGGQGPPVPGLPGIPSFGPPGANSANSPTGEENAPAFPGMPALPPIPGLPGVSPPTSTPQP